jgi:predicted TPR repeat methyltransferase
VIDYGCGYGALGQRLIADGHQFRYTGFDLSEPMLESARGLIDDPRCRFTAREDDLDTADVTLASGIFNVKLDAGHDEWEAYIDGVLDSMASLSTLGFAFNMLSRYSDPPRRRDTLYYANPEHYFALCKRKYSRFVALVHDYDLYEFTVLVRMGAAPAALS